MKLHLPKQLFTALLAAITLAVPAEAIGIGQWTSYDITNSSETAVTAIDGASVSWVTSDGTAVITGIPSYTFRFELTPDWNLADGKQEDLVYVTSAGNMWGFYAYGDGSIAAKATNGLYTTDKNANDAATGGIVSKDSILNSEETSVTLQASINNDGTLLKKLDDTVLYHETGLKWSTETITGLNANTNYIRTIQVITAVDTIDANRPVIVRNQSGSWEKEFSASDTKFILAKDTSEGGDTGRMDVTASAELNGYSNVVVGGSNQLFLQTYEGDGCSENISLGQNIYIGSTSKGAAIRFGMDDYDVTLTGAIYLVENASMSCSNLTDHTITLSGTITDRVVNSQGTTIDTNSTLTLNNGRYDITGTVDVSGFTVQAGVVNVSSGTGNFGNVTLRGGNLNYTGGTHTITGTLISENAGKGIEVGTTDRQRAVLNVNRMELGNISSGTAADTLTIYEGSALKVTGSVNTDANQAFKSRSIVIGEWNQQTAVDVYGDFLAQGAAMYAGIKGGSVNIHSTGTVAVKGLATARTSDTGSVLNVTLHDGGKLILGDTGIAADTVGANIIFNSGTVGMFAQATTIGTNITLQSQAGTVFDSSLYTFSADGLSLQQGSTGGTMTISGAVTGSGKLVKDGVGTLKLSGANTYTGGTTVKGGVLQIASGGSAGTGAVEVQTGATLDVAALPTDWTAASMLSGKVTGTGTLLISTSGLATGNANLTTTFGGTLELAKGITFTLGAATSGSSGDGKVIDTTTLAGVVLNAGESAETGAKLQYHANGNTTLTNLTVNAHSTTDKGFASLYYVDSNKNNALRLDGVTQLGGNLDITTQFDGGVLIKQLSGAGNLSVTGGNGTFKASIESIQNGYTGSLSFSDSELEATVSTGTGERTLSMGSITASGVASFTFNVQRNTVLTSLATASNAKVNLADGTSLTLGGATNTTIGTLSAASGATIALDTNASLTVGTYNAVHTLTISGSGASDGLGFTSITVDNNSHQLTLEGEGSISFVHNRDAVDNASADGNGFRVNIGKYVLFDGYEWTAGENHTLTADGFTLDENQTDGKTILISSGAAGDVFYVNQSNATAYDAGFVADTLNAGTAVEILAGQTLSVETATDVTLDKQLRGEGSLSKRGAGTLTLSGATSFGASVNVSEGSLDVTGTLTAGAITKTGDGTLYLKSGIGERKIKDLTITGGTVRTNQQDALDYNSDTRMSVQNATLDLDARQTVDSSNSFELNSGIISGDGGANNMMNNVTVGLEVHDGSTLLISSEGTSSITTNIGFRNAAGKVEYTVTGGTLTNSGIIASHNNGTTGAVVKKGAGELILSGANTYANGTTVEAGTLTVNHASALGTGSVLLKTGSILTLGATVTNAIQVGVQEDETKNWAEITLSNNAELDHGTKVTTNDGAKVAYTVNSGSTLSISADGNTSNIESLNIAGGTVKLSAWNASLGSSEDAVDMTLSNDGMFSFTNGNSNSNGGKMYLNVEVDRSGKLAGSNNGYDSNIIGTITSNGDSAHDTLKLGKEANNNWWTISATIKDHANGTDKLEVQKVDDVNVVLSGANTYSGGTTIEAGTVTTQNASALGTGGVAVSGTGVLSVAENLKLQDTLQLSGAGEVQVATGKSLNLQDKVSLSSTDGTNAATLTAKANVDALARLQEDATFTIQDMTLTNTTITAATPTTKVSFKNVTVAGATVLRNMQASMPDANVTTGGSEGVKGVFTASTSLLSGITLATGSTITVDLGDLSCAASMDQGKYDLSITLSGFTMEDYSGLATGAGLVFAADSWLGSLLNQAQNANVQMTIAQAEAGAAAAAEGGSASGVSYSTGNVGTVITITGLNVPEPASATLGLAALMMLCARRRRND